MKYPYDIISYVRTKTFSVEAKFVRNSENTSESKNVEFDHPLQIHDDTFSRFVLAIIENGKAATANLSIELLEEIVEATQYAYHKHMDLKYEPKNSTDGNNSIAFTTRFFAGSLKGKSPVDILIDNKNNPEKGKEILNSQYKWLSENIQKYPKNKELIEAIKASSKIDINTLDPTNIVESLQPIEILKIGVRPKIRNKRADGKCFCYEANVLWDFYKKYPISVRIENYYAPVIKKEDGTLNVLISEKDNGTKISNEFVMSTGDWLNAVKEMKRAEQAFYSMNIKDAFDIADRESKKNRLSAETAKKSQAS